MLNVTIKLFVIYFLLISNFSKISEKNDDSNIRTAFVEWNKATISSLKNQSSLSKAKSVVYRNRLQSFKALVEIIKDDEVNLHSIRYQFLNEISTKMNSEKMFYVVEANRSGEFIELKNYVIEISKGSYWVDVYSHDNTKWLKEGATTKINITSRSNLNHMSTKFGFNDNDVIVTKFINKSVVRSDYYLRGTLSSEVIKKVLLLNGR